MADDGFRLELSNATPEELAMICTGVSIVTAQALKARAKGPIDILDGLLHRLLTENRELAREMFLDPEMREHFRVAQMSENMLDDLGLELVDGEVFDASDGDYTDIEVE